MLQSTARLLAGSRELLGRIPRTARVILATFLIAATCLAIYATLTAKTSSFQLHVQHSFRSAQIAVYVDNDLAYSFRLTGTLKKRLGFINEGIQGSLSQSIPVSSGRHTIRINITSDDGTKQEQSISGEFSKNVVRNLTVNARRSGISLAWQAETSDASKPASLTWFSQYASSLLLTIAGSIISAITGFAIRELPKQLASRSSEATKAEAATAGR
jgi:capsular polysaccharide biosynthesis protein